MTIKGGSSHACAACKFQRRKCSSECILAAFFPSDNPKCFQNAHRLFGVRNIVKILKHLDQYQRWEAMKSIIYQSNMRDEFPVHGCCAVIARLEVQIHLAQEEYNAVLAQLAFHRQNQHQDLSFTQNDPVSELQLGMVNPGPSDFTRLPTETDDQIYPNATIIDFDSIYPDKDDMVSSFCIQNTENNGNSDSNGGGNVFNLMRAQMINFNEVPIQQHETSEYGEIHSFFDTIDDRQSFVVSKEPNDSSSDSSLKDTASPVEFIPDNELKNAAACFSLTSVN